MCLSSAIVPGMPTGLPGALFRTKPAEMCKVHPHVTLMTLCKHTPALLLLLNYHLLPIQASQNNCICPFYPVQMAWSNYQKVPHLCLARRNGNVEVAEVALQ